MLVIYSHPSGTLPDHTPHLLLSSFTWLVKVMVRLSLPGHNKRKQALLQQERFRFTLRRNFLPRRVDWDLGAGWLSNRGLDLRFLVQASVCSSAKWD